MAWSSRGEQSRPWAGYTAQGCEGVGTEVLDQLPVCPEAPRHCTSPTQHCFTQRRWVRISREGTG